MKLIMRGRGQRGLSLIETVISVALFSAISFSLYSTWTKVFKTIQAAEARTIAVALGNEQFEIARNLPFAQVGTVSGIPAGILPPVQTFVRSGRTFIATTTVRNIDHPFDGTAGGTPNDLSPADNKLIEMNLQCTSCPTDVRIDLSTWIAPKDLESISTNGSLFIRVMDSGGLPVQGALVHVTNSTLVPAVDIIDVTATSGMLQIIDAPPALTSYEITVTKPGYSSDRTHGVPTTTNPVLPHATVAIQTVTQITLSIDRLAQMDFSSVAPSCGAVANANVQMTGAKLIATLPGVTKNDRWFSTGGSGAISFSDVEWDNYTITASSGTHSLAGVAPLSPVAITPGLTQTIQLIMMPRSAKEVMVTVKDAGTGLPITDAEVTLDLGGATTSLTTGRGFLRQTDWSGGSGQTLLTDDTRYSVGTDVDTLTVPGTIQLEDILGLYPATGELESSIFDTGSASNFYQFTFLPGTQAPETGDSVKFQIASALSTSSPWNYRGPDGTASTYYNATTTDIPGSHNGDRYFRYKAFLSTASSTLTPSVSDIAFTFTSSCIPPGQVLFQGLPDGAYTLEVRKAGYTDFSDTLIIDASTPWQEKTAVLTP